MCEPRHMHLACILSRESLARDCAGALILEPVAAANTRCRRPGCGGCTTRLTSTMNYTWWHPPDTYAMHLFSPLSGCLVDAKVRDATGRSQHPSTWNPASWGRGCSMGWNLTNGRQLLAGKFWCFLLFGWTVCRGNTLSWILGWYSVWDGCDQLRNKSLVFLVHPSQPDSPFPSLLHSLSCTHTEA